MRLHDARYEQKVSCVCPKLEGPEFPLLQATQKQKGELDLTTASAAQVKRYRTAPERMQSLFKSNSNLYFKSTVWRCNLHKIMYAYLKCKCGEL